MMARKTPQPLTDFDRAIRAMMEHNRAEQVFLDRLIVAAICVLGSVAMILFSPAPVIPMAAIELAGAGQ